MPAGLVEVTSNGVWVHGVMYWAGLFRQAGGCAPTIVRVQTPPPLLVKLAPNPAGLNVEPLSSLYGCSTIDVAARSEVVAVSTRRCLPMRYSAGVTTMLVVVVAVTMMVTATGLDDPLAFVAVTLYVYVPATVGMNVNDDEVVAVAAAGVCVVVPTAGPPVFVQTNVGAGTEAVVAVMITGEAAAVPRPTVWLWIGLIVGVGCA